MLALQLLCYLLPATTGALLLILGRRGTGALARATAPAGVAAHAARFAPVTLLPVAAIDLLGPSETLRGAWAPSTP